MFIRVNSMCVNVSVGTYVSMYNVSVNMWTCIYLRICVITYDCWINIYVCLCVCVNLWAHTDDIYWRKCERFIYFCELANLCVYYMNEMWACEYECLWVYLCGSLSFMVSIIKFVCKCMCETFLILSMLMCVISDWACWNIWVYMLTSLCSWICQHAHVTE